MSANATSGRQARMRSLVDEHARFVTRTLRRAGVPRSDLDDEVQRTFITAANRLDDVQPGAERSFLFQVALNIASHARRALARRRELPSDHLPERIEPLGTPEDFTASKQTRRLLEEAVAGMPESLRSVVMLYEMEEMDTHEIAVVLGIPRGTVASRLRRARAQLRRNLAAIELAWELDIAGDEGVGEPARLRRERVGALVRALLGAGAAKPLSAAMRAKILRVCLADRR
jgi:RNA polymerase sigma-70 factor, ECF subfamily